MEPQLKLSQCDPYSVPFSPKQPNNILDYALSLQHFLSLSTMVIILKKFQVSKTLVYFKET